MQRGSPFGKASLLYLVTINLPPYLTIGLLLKRRLKWFIINMSLFLFDATNVKQKLIATPLY
jgi:hypothetical protein